MKKYNFTKIFIEALKPASAGKRDFYRDAKDSGLEIMVTDKGNKSFKVTRKKQGRLIRVTLGSYPEMSIENARIKAFEVSSQIAGGVNPNDEKNNLRQEITFGELFHEFMERYAKKQKITWKQDQNRIDQLCPHLFNKKISLISAREIKLLHEKVGDENGIYQANRLLASLGTIYNKAIEWGWKGENPVKGIKKFKEFTRDRFIQPDELPRFFKALAEEENQVAQHYIYISLYTGARKANVLAMRWDEINFTSKEWRIPKTKNGESLSLPLISEAIGLLKIRKKENQKLELSDLQNQWVFPSLTSKSGHLEDPKKAWHRILKKAEIKDLRIHDIRRTLGSYQAIGGTSLPIIGKSLGHKSSQATQIYSRMNLDPVRQSVESAVELMQKYKK